MVPVKIHCYVNTHDIPIFKRSTEKSFSLVEDTADGKKLTHQVFRGREHC